MCAMFGSEDQVTLAMISSVFGEPGELGTEYIEGDPYHVAGPFKLDNYYISFTLDDDNNAVYAKVSLKQDA